MIQATAQALSAAELVWLARRSSMVRRSWRATPRPRPPVGATLANVSRGAKSAVRRATRHVSSLGSDIPLQKRRSPFKPSNRRLASLPANRRTRHRAFPLNDSGLVANPSDPAEVAADPDYADLLPYVDLLSKPARTRARTIQDLVVGYERLQEGRKRWETTVQVSNLTNRTALFNFQSIFVGTRLVQPRTAGIRVRWYF